jgi:hypothetical protein
MAGDEVANISQKTGLRGGINNNEAGCKPLNITCCKFILSFTKYSVQDSGVFSYFLGIRLLLFCYLTGVPLPLPPLTSKAKLKGGRYKNLTENG